MTGTAPLTRGNRIGQAVCFCTASVEFGKPGRLFESICGNCTGRLVRDHRAAHI